MQNVRIEKYHLLGYHNIYEDDNLEPYIALKDIPLTSALEFVCYLLHLYNVRKKNDTEFQSRQLMGWMMQLESVDKVKVATFIQQESKIIFDSSFKLIDRRPFLNLIQHILVYCHSNDRALNRSDHTILFKCLLHFNSQENQKQEDLFNWDGKGGIEQFVNHILVVQVKNIEHERFKDYILQFLKVYYFFKFCESDFKYSSHLQFFLSNLGLRSYTGYLLKLISPYLNLMVNEPPTPKMQIDDNKKGLDFYDRLTINGKIKTIDKDYKPIRQYPLFKGQMDTYVFMDFRFFVDKLYQGFLFDFAATCKIPYGNLKTDMGNEFSEHILFYTVMGRCFNSFGDIRLTGEQIKAKISAGEPDYYIRKGTETFLFEFKDVVIPADIKYAGNSEKIKNGILDKLEKSSKGKRKGIGQLLNTVKNIVSGLYLEKGVDNTDLEEPNFYPIIVHTDITLESCGVNYFLNNRMMELINELELTNQKIKNLVMINIDTLMKLQDHFNDGKLDLGECINSYIQYISSGDAQTATFPFDEFIKYHFVETNAVDIGNPKDFTSIISSFVTPDS